MRSPFGVPERGGNSVSVDLLTTGRYAAGETLTASWSGTAPESAAYQWQGYDGSAWVDIPGATGASYTQIEEPEYQNIRCIGTPTLPARASSAIEAYFGDGLQITNNLGLTLTARASGTGWDITGSGDADYDGTYHIESAALADGLPVQIVAPLVSEAGGVLTARPGLWISPLDSPLSIDAVTWIEHAEAGDIVGGEAVTYIPVYTYTAVSRRETAANAAGVVVADTPARARSDEPTWAALAADPAIRAVWDAQEAATLLRSDGSPVTTAGQEVASWRDRIGGVTAVADVVAHAPHLRIDGKLRSVESDGVDDRLTAATRFGLGANPALTISALLQAGASDPEQWLLQIGSASTATLGFALGGSNIAYRHGGAYRLFGPPPIGAWSIIQWVRPAGGTCASGRVFVDGVERSATTTNNGTQVPADTAAMLRLFTSGSAYARTRPAALIIQQSDADAVRALAYSWLDHVRSL